jgi:hypothetical protein
MRRIEDCEGQRAFIVVQNWCLRVKRAALLRCPLRTVFVLPIRAYSQRNRLTSLEKGWEAWQWP